MTIFRENLPQITSKIRLLHAIPLAPNVDVYFNGNLTAQNIAFGTTTSYISIPPGDYSIEIYPSGNTADILLNKKLSIGVNTVQTLSIVTIYNNIDFLLLSDRDDGKNIEKSFLRFINLSPNSPLLSLSLPNNEILFDSVEYLETNNYAEVSSGIYEFEVSFSNYDISSYLSDIKLYNGKKYTVYIIGLFNAEPKLGYILTNDNLY